MCGCVLLACGCVQVCVYVWVSPPCYSPPFDPCPSSWSSSLIRCVPPTLLLLCTPPQNFTEEQLAQYKEYQAKEKAAVEERVKRKALLETELRTLRGAAEEVVARFDEALAALAATRLEVAAEVVAVEAQVGGVVDIEDNACDVGCCVVMQ